MKIKKNEHPDDQSQGGITIRVPSKAAMAVVVALGGAAWNKFEAWSIEKSTQSVQAGSYAVISASLEDTVERIETLERHARTCQREIDNLYTLGGDLSKKIRGVKVPEREAAPISTAIPAEPLEFEDATMEVEYEAAGLPSFDQIQQRVQKSPPAELVKEVRKANAKRKIQQLAE